MQWFSQAAVRKLTVRKLLAKVAADDKDSDIQQIAIKKLTSRKFLAKPAAEYRDSVIRAKTIHLYLT